MLSSDLKITARNISRNKVFSLVNMLGLALGMGCSLLIMLWVMDEKGTDAFHENSDRLYSVYERQYHDGQVDAGYYTPGYLSREMKLVLPEVELATPFGWNTLKTFQVGEKILKVDGNSAGEDFFQMFSYKLLEGTPKSALKNPNDIAISRKMANDFFGSPEKAIGKSLFYENHKDLNVAAVFDDLPKESSVQFEYLLNWETFLEENAWAKDWGNNGPTTWFMTRKDVSTAALAKKMEPFLDLYNKYQTDNFKIRLSMQPYKDRYLHSTFKDGLIVGGRIQYVQLFSIVAIFILLIACINFMNLTTARSVKRAKEIGVRKVVGAFRNGLIRQFLTEALVTVSISVVLALLFVAIILPLFNTVTHKHIAFPFASLPFWLSMAGLTFLTGIISGSYPALYLSSFKPARVLKGTFNFSSGAIWFRKGLVVFQFTLSIMLIVGTIIVSRQVDYIQSTNLGFDRQNMFYLTVEGELAKKYKVLKERALSIPGVQMVSRISQTPIALENGTGGVSWDGKDPNSNLQFTQAGVGYDFVNTMHLNLLQGRDFSADRIVDSTNYIVNESALKIIGYKNPIGMPLTMWDKKGTIIGVMQDAHMNSMHSNIRPLVIRLEKEDQNDGGLILIRTEKGKTKEALAGMEQLCKEINPKFPFTYSFLDEEYKKLYASEQVVQSLSNGFAFLAIFISCLGLLGLSMFTAEQRTKEVGIRKILGASMFSLFNLLSKELIILVVVALVFATPLAWWGMDNWLQGYAYKTSIGVWIFVAAGACAVVIALFTVSFQTIKALVANPVNSLREN